MNDPNDPRTAAYWGASVDTSFPAMTAVQERAVWQQAFIEQKERADSLFRSWFVTAFVLVVSNGIWILEWWMR